MDIDQIVNSGFFMKTDSGEDRDLAITSLMIAIKNFFSTYDSMRYFFSIRNERDAHYPVDYYACYCDSVVHFQHFSELAVKHFLREEHELLVTVANKDAIILHKLLKNESVCGAEIEGTRSIEFSEALDTLIKLINAGRINSCLGIFNSFANCLRKINMLRNRVWHRGAFILTYDSLDQLFCEHLIPVARKIANLPNYAKLERYWKYQDLNCKIDVLEELELEGQKGSCDNKKIAWLKELGRAAYVNPLPPRGLDEEDIRRFEHMAKTNQTTADVKFVKKCPVCGCKTLVVYKDHEESYEGEKLIDACEFTWRAVCVCCTFEVNKELGNPSEHGLKEIEDLWEARSCFKDA